MKWSLLLVVFQADDTIFLDFSILQHQAHQAAVALGTGQVKWCCLFTLQKKRVKMWASFVQASGSCSLHDKSWCLVDKNWAWTSHTIWLTHSPNISALFNDYLSTELTSWLQILAPFFRRTVEVWKRKKVLENFYRGESCLVIFNVLNNRFSKTLTGSLLSRTWSSMFLTG